MKLIVRILSKVTVGAVCLLCTQAGAASSQAIVEKVQQNPCYGRTVSGYCVVENLPENAFPLGPVKVNAKLHYNASSSEAPTNLLKLLASQLQEEALDRVHRSSQQMSLASISEIYVSLQTSGSYGSTYSYPGYDYSQNGIVQVSVVYNTNPGTVVNNTALEQCLNNANLCQTSTQTGGALPKVKFLVNDTALTDYVVIRNAAPVRATTD